MFTKKLATRAIAFVLVSVGVLAIACTASATVIHSGAADPETEGWTLVAGGNATQVGGTEVTASGSHAYWQTADPDSASNGWYEKSATGIVDGVSDWTLTCTLRGFNVSSPTWPVSVGVADRANGAQGLWNLQISDVSGSAGLYYSLYGELTLLKAMDVSTDYHTYQMYYNWNTDSVAVYVDGGTSVGTIHRAQADGVFRGVTAMFGSVATGPSGTGNYAYVAVEAGNHVVPEPSALLLLATGLVGLLAYAWRKRR